MDSKDASHTKRKLAEVEVQEEEEPKKEQKPEELDAFYARMIQKKQLQNQFYKERMLKNPKGMKNL